MAPDPNVDVDPERGKRSLEESKRRAAGDQPVLAAVDQVLAFFKKEGVENHWAERVSIAFHDRGAT